MKTLKIVFILTFLLTAALPGVAWAADTPVVNTGDTTFIIISTAMVFLMTPGLALFYGGMVRKKNVLGTTMQSVIAIALISVQWIIIGYTLSFGPDNAGLIGGLEWLGLKGVGLDPNPDYAATIPAQLFMAFQMMFAIITPALISGSVAERMRFPAFAAFILLWATLVYDPVAHWVWGVNGWIRNLGAIDFAGGTVVHIISGVSALVACLVLGKRKNRPSEPTLPHNIPMVVMGASLLWFGWFGFNAGSALGANGIAAAAFVNTNTAAAAAALGWLIAEWMHHGKPTVLGLVSGAVAGLVAITPAAGFVTPMAAIVIGIVSGVLCYFMIAVVKGRLGYDDSLDAFGMHGIGGTWGAIATGFFATKTVNPAGADGLFYGDPSLVIKQLIAVAATYAFAAISTYLILKAVSLVFKLRVLPEEEESGLDITQHGEDAYRDFAVGSTVTRSTKVGIHNPALELKLGGVFHEKN
ncbi:ammonium transporter [Phosphitispora sp. TUW77]|uniref:ammonium transporter n=1 Tax=Phosphitispora sp. TUW77 TaxID=3152361 RepID=UPI003AB847F3